MYDQTIQASDFRTPQFATLDLAGWLVTEVRPVAKYLLVTVAAPENVTDTAQQFVVLSHLGMDGSWQIDTKPTYRTRCILRFAEHSVVGNSLKLLEVLPVEQAEDHIAFLGPDLLDPGWEDPDTADRKSTRLNSSHVAISYAVFCLKKKKSNQ